VNWFSIRCEARRRARETHIGELERSVGYEPSVNEHGLPRIVVERNPEGEWLMTDRWKTRGFAGERYGGVYYEVKAATKRGCIRKARRRLRALVEKDLVGVTEVTL